MYEGCRRGISGLGGAGVRGYLVRAPAGDVGDLSCAEMSFGFELPPAPPRELPDWLFFCLRCRRDSSLCSLMRMDLLDGLISSELCGGFAREFRRPDPLLFPMTRSWSDSDSLERPEDDEPDDITGRADMALPRPMLMVSLGSEPSLLFSFAAAVGGCFRYAPKIRRSGSREEKLPSSS